MSDEATVRSKSCTGCGQTKPVSEFHRRISSSDGLRFRCKACTLAENRAAYRPDTPEERARNRVNAQRYRERNREKERERSLRNLAGKSPSRDPLKEAARRALRNAVQASKIAKPAACEDCGAGGVIHGHHEDYARPFDVAWLCGPCHGKRHRKEADVVAV